MSDFESESSEEGCILAHPCRWGWCREILPTKDALIAHLLEHTKHVIPVRRKDVALLRRIEEGTQQSLRISLLRDSLPGSAAGSQQHAESSQGIDNETLPSPPHPNGMLHTPVSETRVLPQHESSSSSSSNSPSLQGEQNKPHTSPVIPYPEESVAATPNAPRQQHGVLGHVTPTFASLNSPTNSQVSQASRTTPNSIPNSPSFSSLVKRKSETEHQQQLSRSNLSSQSRSSAGTSGSSGSQMSVEKQLTQSPRSDIASEVNASSHRKIAMHDSFSPPGLDGDVTMSQNLYKVELAWDRAEEPENVFLSQQPSQAVEFELLTQPPSQLQLGTFPFHNHRKSRNAGVSQAEPTSSMSFRPSPTVQAMENTFAASTPQPQPARRQTRSQSRGPEPAPVQAKLPSTPAKRTTSSKAASASRTPKPKSTKPRSRSFRSGTLQITPLAQPQPSTITEETSQQLQQGLTAEELLNMHNPLYHFNGSPGQSQSSFQSMDFAELQTQAPYESQPMSQY
ncbi:hypothetical protein D9619_000638 [Psilocybe cf. subviscida]|uniref:Uncharacterized protein n=1 Tax=Psilocybe cf. subviscida TaxID=2480587 RepID=A0A8H5F2Z3_9AGAR|nr:hypothetical protein D9619_000638 [Psilocybe cf. subviscida]